MSSCLYPNALDYEGKFIGHSIVKEYLANPVSLKLAFKHLIPCGQCLACRLKRSEEWAYRCMAEASLYKHNYFVTLTYDETHLQKFCKESIDSFDFDSGEILFRSSLEKDRISRFMKALRQNLGDGIRFFGCGEYGSTGLRPHYHVCLFNMPQLTLVPWKNCDGYQIYRSPEIERTWKLGFSTVGDLNYETCAYTARYIMKKQLGQSRSDFERICSLVPNIPPFVPEYVVMSRRPGIARAWLGDPSDPGSEIRDIYSTDSVVMNLGKKGVRLLKPPRYYDKIFDQFAPDEMEQIKMNRMKLSSLRSYSVSKLTDLDENELLEQARIIMQRRVNRLSRKEF